MNQTITKKQTLKAVNKAWTEFAYVLDTCGWGRDGVNYLKLNVAEEKDHDRYRGDSIGRGITITEAAKLFAVKQLVEYLTESEKAPDPKGYNHMRKTVFMAYGLVSDYTKQLMGALAKLTAEEVETIKAANAA